MPSVQSEGLPLIALLRRARLSAIARIIYVPRAFHERV